MEGDWERGQKGGGEGGREQVVVAVMVEAEMVLLLPQGRDDTRTLSRGNGWRREGEQRAEERPCGRERGDGVRRWMRADHNETELTPRAVRVYMRGRERGRGRVCGYAAVYLG